MRTNNIINVVPKKELGDISCVFYIFQNKILSLNYIKLCAIHVYFLQSITFSCLSISHHNAV